MGPPPRPLLDRFVDFIELANNGCWNWTGFKDRNGYGQIRERVSINLKKTKVAARIAYELFIGDIPNNPALKDTPGEITIDHKCKNASCVNPNHLQLLTRSLNSIEGGAKVHAVKTHCPSGHEYTKANTQVRKLPNGRLGRSCRECKRLSVLVSSHKRKGLPVTYAPRLREFVHHVRREAL